MQLNFVKRVPSDLARAFPYTIGTNTTEMGKKKTHEPAQFALVAWVVLCGARTYADLRQEEVSARQLAAECLRYHLDDCRLTRVPSQACGISRDLLETPGWPEGPRAPSRRIDGTAT